MKKISLKTGIEKIQLVALRFPFTLFFILGLFILSVIQIHNLNINILPNKWTFFGLGILLSLSVTLFSEEFKNKFVNVGLNLLSIIALMIFCYFLPDKFNPVNHYQVISIGLSLGLSAFVVSFLKKDNAISFWEFSKSSILQLIITSIFASVLMAGISLAVLSLETLFKIEIRNTVYQYISAVCYLLFAPVYFLTTIISKDEKHAEKYTFNSFLKILGLYIFLPILAVYTLILYVYLAKIIAKWELPNGWVSTLVSILGLGGFLSMMVLFPLKLEKENKIVKLFSNYFPVVLLPLLVLMSIGIFRRFDDYGYTINRLYVIILNFWLYGICIYLFITKAAHLKWIVISFAVVLLVSSVGPWSVYSITRRNMLKEIGQLLTEKKLLKDGKVIDNSNKTIKLDSITSEKISSKIRYTFFTYGLQTLQPFFKDSIEKKSFSALEKQIGINYYFGESVSVDRDYFEADLENNQTVELANFKVFINLNHGSRTDTLFADKNLTIKLVAKSIQIFKPNQKLPYISIPIDQKAKELYGKYTDNEDYKFTMEELTLQKDNYKLILNQLQGNYFVKKDSLTISNLEANLFLK